MAQLIGGTLLVSHQQEKLLFMDKFGKSYIVLINVSQGATRAAKITSTLAMLQTQEDNLTAYASANGHDLTADLAAGAAAIAAAIAAYNATNPQAQASTTAVVSTAVAPIVTPTPSTPTSTGTSTPATSTTSK